MLDEAFRVARLTGPDTKVVLKIGEGTDATRELYEERPSSHGKMNRWHPAPARGECSTEKRKQDEGQVEQENAVSCKTKVHANAGAMVDAARGRGSC